MTAPNQGQLTYGDPTRGLAGQDRPAFAGKYDETAYNAEASAAIRFGIFVTVGTPVAGPPSNAMPIKLISSTSDKPAGVTRYHRTYDLKRELDDTTGGVKPNIEMSVRRWGPVLVRVEGTIVANVDRPHVRAVSGAGGTVLGVARASAVGGETIDCTNYGIFISDDFTSVEGVKVAWLFVGTIAALATPSGGSVTAAALSAQLKADIVDDIEFVVGAESANAIAVTVQLEDPADADVTGARGVHWWLSSTPGGAVVSTAPTGGIAFSGSGVVSLLEDTTDKFGHVITGATGSFVATLTDTGTPTFYLNVVCGDGAVKTSPAITFA